MEKITNTNSPDESGLIILKLFDKDYPARITIRAAMITEKLLDKPLHAVLERILAAKQFFLEEMATVFQQAILAENPASVLTVEAIAGEIVKQGQPKFATAYMNILLGALRAPKGAPVGEAKATK